MYLYLECTVKRVQANIVTTNIFKQSVANMTRMSFVFFFLFKLTLRAESLYLDLTVVLDSCYIQSDVKPGNN